MQCIFSGLFSFGLNAFFNDDSAFFYGIRTGITFEALWMLVKTQSGGIKSVTNPFRRYRNITVTHEDENSKRPGAKNRERKQKHQLDTE